MIGELFNVGSFSEVSNVKEASVVDSDLEKNMFSHTFNSEPGYITYS